MASTPKPDPTRRFSARATNYAKYRPRYPDAVLQTLREECGLTPRNVIADVGSGTGILSELFLKNGHQVFGIEPNPEMRGAAERSLRKYENFTSINATAEATTLSDDSVDFVTAGQAFHWFDTSRARKEFVRVLRPQGWVVLVWNTRVKDSSPFAQAYEALLQKYGTDYATVSHDHTDASAIGAFFSPQPFTLRKFENRRVLDFDSVQGRLLSSSYTPEPGQANYQSMLDELRSAFHQHQTGGTVDFDYVTLMYCGQLS